MSTHRIAAERLAALGWPVVEVYESNGRGGIGAAGWNAPVAIAVRDEAAAHELLRMLSLAMLPGGYARARVHRGPGDASEWLVAEEQVSRRG